MIWLCASFHAEITSDEIIHPIFEEKFVEGRLIKRQFSIKYFAVGFAMNLDGTYVTRPDGLESMRDRPKLACKESKAGRFEAQSRRLNRFNSFTES